MNITNKHPFVEKLLIQDPLLKKLFDIVPATIIPFDEDGFHFLMFTITGQQVSAHVAHIIFKRLKSLVMPFNRNLY
jgi:3-methyladenine DNA glycosylase/8-oxoguanine DNA glycosylase